MAKTIAVIGGGSAGLTAATTARDLGARVVFCMGPDPDRASLCVNRGCMPSKALFERLDAIHHAGGEMPLPPIGDRQLERIVAWKDRHIARFRAFRQSAIRSRSSDDFIVVRSPARLIDANTIEADNTRYSFDAVVIATGSKPDLPPIDGLAALADLVWTSDELLDNTRVPDSLVIIGAGAIGLEFSVRYARFGCAVTIVSRSRVLPEFPVRFGERIQAAYERDGVRFLPLHRVVAIRRDIEGWFVCETEGPSRTEPVVGERLLIATGRGPQLDGLDLGTAGIELEAGRLVVGSDMRVLGHDNVFAAGDVTGDRLVVHQAHIEAGIAARNAVDDGDRTWDRRADLQVVFSSPEFAYAGATPARLESTGRKIVTAHKESRNVGKLFLGGDDIGFGEFVADAETGTLLGAGLLCDHASDLIHLPSTLIELEHTVYDAAALEFYHPARIEIVSGIIDEICAALGGDPFCRAPE